MSTFGVVNPQYTFYGTHQSSTETEREPTSNPFTAESDQGIRMRRSTIEKSERIQNSRRNPTENTQSMSVL